jgi:hypothetical protein
VTPTAAGEGGADVIPTAAGPGGAEQGDEAARAEYRKTGAPGTACLPPAEVGRKNKIAVTPDEVNQAIARDTRDIPVTSARCSTSIARTWHHRHLRAPIRRQGCRLYRRAGQDWRTQGYPAGIVAIPDPAGKTRYRVDAIRAHAGCAALPRRT